MGLVQRGQVGRKPTGGTYKQRRGKKLYEAARRPTLTRVAAVRKYTDRTKGGHEKVRLMFSDVANLFDPKTKKYAKAAIKLVSGNPANRHYVRRNIITKGSIIETDKGKARVTNRPGQEGQVNAVLV